MFNFLVGIFCKFRLVANVTNYWTMTCQSGAPWSGILEEAVGWQFTDLGASYHEKIRRHIPCPECGVELIAGSMTVHQIRINGTDPTIDWN